MGDRSKVLQRISVYRFVWIAPVARFCGLLAKICLQLLGVPWCSDFFYSRDDYFRFGLRMIPMGRVLDIWLPVDPAVQRAGICPGDD
jgi:hypothetical protein